LAKYIFPFSSEANKKLFSGREYMYSIELISKKLLSFTEFNWIFLNNDLSLLTFSKSASENLLAFILSKIFLLKSNLSFSTSFVKIKFLKFLSVTSGILFWTFLTWNIRIKSFLSIIWMPLSNLLIKTSLKESLLFVSV